MAKLFTKKGISRLILILALLLPWVWTFGTFLVYLLGHHQGLSDSYFFDDLNRVFVGDDWRFWDSSTDTFSNIESFFFSRYGNYWSKIGLDFVLDIGPYYFNPLGKLTGFLYYNLIIDVFNDITFFPPFVSYWLWGVVFYSLDIVIIWSFVNILSKLLLIPLHVVDWFTSKVGGSND